MTASTIKMTARQFLELGEDPPGVRLELVNGEIAVSPGPTPLHSHVVVELIFRLAQHVKKKRLGKIFSDVDTRFGEHDVRRPDLLFFSTDRLHLIGEKAVEGPPDLCVEVISPSSVTIDRRQKFKQFAKGGVPHYWIVDPQARTIEGYRLVRGKYELALKAKGNQSIHLQPFDDLEIPLAELWDLRS